jgi:S-adenosylmethionine:tRNA-ribosyltransferase-isomerase (queuine synthetase)
LRGPVCVPFPCIAYPTSISISPELIAQTPLAERSASRLLQVQGRS